MKPAPRASASHLRGGSGFSPSLRVNRTAFLSSRHQPPGPRRRSAPALEAMMARSPVDTPTEHHVADDDASTGPQPRVTAFSKRFLSYHA